MNLGWEAKGGRATENSRNKWTNTLRRQKNNISAGDFVSEDWVFAGVCMYATEDRCPSLNKPHHVTYADGAYMVVKAEAVRSLCPEGKPFIDETHLYLDDTLLSLTLWSNGRHVAYVHARAGFHYANMTTKPILSYCDMRGIIAAIEIVFTRYSTYKPLYYLRRGLGNKVLCSLGRKERYRVYEAYLVG